MWGLLVVLAQYGGNRDLGVTGSLPTQWTTERPAHEEVEVRLRYKRHTDNVLVGGSRYDDAEDIPVDERAGDFLGSWRELLSVRLFRRTP